MPKYRRGSGSIYLRGKIWWLSYYVGGKNICESSGTRDRAEARRLLQERIGQVARGRFARANRITFEDLAEILLDDYRTNNKKTLAWAERRIRLHLAPFFSGAKAQEITTADIRAYIRIRQQKGASNAEINRELSLLKRTYNLANQANNEDLRPPYIPCLEENNVRQGFFERPEFEAVLARLPDYLRPPITFAYYMGWRILSEVLPLTWDQLDLEVGAVLLEVGTTKSH